MYITFSCDCSDITCESYYAIELSNDGIMTGRVIGNHYVGKISFKDCLKLFRFILKGLVRV